jgi:hypothetical protein
MASFSVPKGLKSWNRFIKSILRKPFPPPDSPNREPKPDLHKLSNWTLVCEEMIDTVPPPGLLKQYHEELLRRGFSDESIREMRHFAWLTAGWLNFEKMLWDWYRLDESDIKFAIEWQLKDGVIDHETALTMLQYMEERNRSTGWVDS